VGAVPAIWIGRLRTDRAAIFRVNASKTSNAAAAASGVTVVEEDLAGVTVLAVGHSAAVLIALVVAASVVVAVLADLAEVGEAGGEGKNKCLEWIILFSKN
jgi:hypothetical protein